MSKELPTESEHDISRDYGRSQIFYISKTNKANHRPIYWTLCACARARVRACVHACVYICMRVCSRVSVRACVGVMCR